MFKILSLICFAYLINLSELSHFYGGTISSKPVKDQGDFVTLNFTISFSYRSSYSEETFCDSNTISNNLLIGPSYDINCAVGCSHMNEIIGNTRIYCTSYSEVNDWSFGTRTFSHTIPKTSNYEINFTGSDWGDLVVFGINSTGALWEIRHILNSTNQTDTNKINSSPVTLMSPVITLPINNYYILDIPFTDDDEGDVVRCRWAEWTNNECKDVCMSVPFSHLDGINCKLHLNTSLAELGLYAAAIQLEDFREGSFETPISSVPLQFLIQIIEESECQLPPELVYEYPKDACIAADQQFEIEFLAYSKCHDVNITEIQLIGPPGSFMEELTFLTPKNMWSRKLYFNNTKIGQHLVCAKAIDVDVQSSNYSCFKVLIGSTTPIIIHSSIFPTGNLHKTNEIINFTGEFNIPVRKPSIPVLIRFYSKENNQQIYSISSENVTFYQNSTKIKFEIDISHFEFGEYYIFFDYGVAVSDGLCKPISEKINNVTFWEFSLIQDISTSESKKFSTEIQETNQSYDITKTNSQILSTKIIIEETTTDSRVNQTTNGNYETTDKNSEFFFTTNTVIDEINTYSEVIQTTNGNYGTTGKNTQVININTYDENTYKTGKINPTTESVMTLKKDATESQNLEDTTPFEIPTNREKSSSNFLTTSNEQITTWEKKVTTESITLNTKNNSIKVTTNVESFIFSTSGFQTTHFIQTSPTTEKIFISTETTEKNAFTTTKGNTESYSFSTQGVVNSTQKSTTGTLTSNLNMLNTNSTFSFNKCLNKTVNYDQKNSNLNDCNLSSLTLVFILINFILVILHHLIIWRAVVYFRK